MKWRPEDVSFDVVADLSETPVVTVRIDTPDGILLVMAEPEEDGHTLVLRRFHAQGARPNAVGAGNLRLLADIVMDRMDYDGIVIEGAARTSGARPGRRPGPFRLARRRIAARRSGSETP